MAINLEGPPADLAALIEEMALAILNAEAAPDKPPLFDRLAEFGPLGQAHYRHLATVALGAFFKHQAGE